MGRGLSVASLPAVRDALAERERERLRESGDWGPVWRRLMERAWGSADALSTAPLWWVSEAMEAAACDLARTGADADVVPATRTGLVAFQRDLPAWASDGLPHRVRAIQWTSWDATRGDERGLEVGVALYTADRDACAEAGGGIPLAQIVTRADEPSRAATAAAVRVLRAMWLLSSQAEDAPAVGRAPGGPGSGGGPDPMARTVKVLVLREARREPTGEAGPRRAPGHRYVVRGFWRHQPCGPRLSERRLTWVGPYVRGPAGAPLVVRETVRVWRR